jgi:hypothetical protein
MVSEQLNANRWGNIDTGNACQECSCHGLEFLSLPLQSEPFVAYHMA